MTLPTQSRFWGAQRVDLPQSQLAVSLPVPQADEAVGIILQELLLNGSEQTQQVLRDYGQKGINVTAQRQRDRIMLSVQGPSGQDAAMAECLVRLLTQPQWDPLHLKRIQTRGHEVLTAKAKLAGRRQQEQLLAALFGKQNPLARSLTQTIQAMDALQPEQFNAVCQYWWGHPEAINWMAVSNQPVSSVYQLLAQQMAQRGWPPAQLSSQANGVLLNNELSVKEVILEGNALLRLPEETLTQSNIGIGMKSLPYGDPDYWVKALLLNHLLSDQGLTQKLRHQDHLIYGLQAEHLTWTEGGFLKLSTNVDFDKTQQAIASIQQFFKTIQTQGLTSEEFETAKRRLIIEEANAQQSGQGIISSAKRAVDRGYPPITASQLKTVLSRITLADVQRVANRLWNPAQGGVLPLAVSAPAAVLDRQVNKQKITAKG